MVHSAVVVRIGRRADRKGLLPSRRTWPGNRQSTISTSERFTMPFVAAALPDSAAEATTRAAGARPSAMRPNERAKRTAFMESFLSEGSLEAQADAHVLEVD